MAEEKKTTLPAGWEAGEEGESNWKKFDKVGDNIKGTLIDKRFQEAQDVYGAQWIYELKVEDGTIWNVPVSAKKAGTIQRLNSLPMGTIVGVLFESEGASAVKGGHKAKNLKIINFGTDHEYVLEGKEASEEEAPDFG